MVGTELPDTSTTSRIRDRIADILHKINTNAIASAAISSVLGSVPVIGTFLSKAYDNSVSPAGDGQAQLVALLEKLRDANAHEMESIIRMMRDNQVVIEKEQVTIGSLLSMAKSISEKLDATLGGQEAISRQEVKTDADVLAGFAELKKETSSLRESVRQAGNLAPQPPSLTQSAGTTLVVDFAPIVSSGEDLRDRLVRGARYNRDRWSDEIPLADRVTTAEVTEWYANCLRALEVAFGKNSAEVKEWLEFDKQESEYFSNETRRGRDDWLQMEAERVDGAIRVLKQKSVLGQAIRSKATS